MSTEFINVNGIKVANIKNESNNVFFGIATLCGSNYETKDIAGISHFTEHMFFKGTERRNWKQINQEFAKLGVSQNAYTSHNEVFYFSTAPKENISGVINMMMDMLFHSTIPTEELDKERSVILEEKKMCEDNPSRDFVNKLLGKFFVWEKGHSTIGTTDVIKKVKREDLKDFLETNINPSNMIFICSGNIDTKDLARYIEESMPNNHPYLDGGEKNIITTDLWTDIVDNPDRIKYLVERENIKQSNVVMLANGLPAFDENYVNSRVAISAIGGGMYSKLFSRIREELGLCYSVNMTDYIISYPTNSLLWLSGSMSPENVELFIDECEKLLKDVYDNGLDEDIFECAKTDLLASTYRKIETSRGKASIMVDQYLYGKEDNLKDEIAKIKAVTIKGCNETLNKILSQPFNWAVMNPKRK